MKKIILAILFVFVYSNLIAQETKNFKSFYKAFKNKDNVVSISAPTAIAGFFVSHHDRELRRIIRKSRFAKVLIIDDTAREIDNAISTYLPATYYEKFLYIKEGSTKINFLVKDTENSISEIIILIQETNTSLIAIGIYGNFKHSDLEQFNKEL